MYHMNNIISCAHKALSVIRKDATERCILTQGHKITEHYFTKNCGQLISTPAMDKDTWRFAFNNRMQSPAILYYTTLG